MIKLFIFLDYPREFRISSQVDQMYYMFFLLGIRLKYRLIYDKNQCFLEDMLSISKYKFFFCSKCFL
jgi:hypothetical protein